MDMDHADAIELMDLAAVEPGGLDRLMAGDTTESGAVAGHLAGCPACAAELVRVRRTAAIVRDVIAAAPDPALRERTLAFVREVGRDRSAGTVEPAASEVRATGPVLLTAASPSRAPIVDTVRPAASRRSWLRYGAIAAALVLATGIGFSAATVSSPEQRLGYEIQALEDATQMTMLLEAQPDRQRVVLAATAAGGSATGTLLFSPSTGGLVMIAEGLPALAPGEEYGCWVEVNGTKTRIGRMYPGGYLQAWAGTVDVLAALPPGAVFGVSHVPAGAVTGEPVLLGGA
jgi:hypothetical protein